MQRRFLAANVDRRLGRIFAILAVYCCFVASAGAHPGSGIIVDANGQVFFVYTGHGVMQIQADGKLTCIHPSRGGHWLCLDPQGSFSRTQPSYFERITPEGLRPAILFADGGAPITIGDDGNLYYASGITHPDQPPPGGLTVTRMTTDDTLTQFAPELAKRLAAFEEGVTGLASGPGGSLYVASPSSIFKVAMNGNVTTVAHPVVVPDCDEDPPDHDATRHTPFLRGLAVDATGVVFAAAPSCHRVLKIAQGGAVSVILKSDRPWSPTAIALHGDEVYILEYTNANGGPDENEGWLPRVRKLDRNGKLTTLATVLPPAGGRRP